MHEHPENLRLAAEVAFFESLDQLQNILAQEGQTEESEYLGSEDYLAQIFPDSKAMDDAVADLDAFFGDVPQLLDGEDEVVG
ncbi:MAG: hypothetical protein U7123_22530 [Potamolinea sp.]